MKFVKIEDVEKILGDIYESMGSSRHNWYDPLRKNDVEEWWWSNDKNNDFVEHAHWIEEEDCTAVTDIPWSMCSACGSYSLKLPYCAFCGAKMDEEAEADE